MTPIVPKPYENLTTCCRTTHVNPAPNGAIATMTYDAKGNLLTSTEQSIAATTTFVYEPTFNQVTRITDPKGNRRISSTMPQAIHSPSPTPTTRSRP